MLPLSTGESPTFHKTINKIPMRQGTVPERKTFAGYLDKAYSDTEKELKKTFKSLEYVFLPQKETVFYVDVMVQWGVNGLVREESLSTITDLVKVD